MNILFFCDEYPPGRHGGIGTVVQLLGRELVRQGHKVWVAGLYDYGYGGADEEEDQGVKVYRLRKKHDRGWISGRYTLKDRILLRLLEMTGRRQKDAEEGVQRLLAFANELIARESIDIAELPDFFHFTQYLKRPLHFPALRVPYVVKLHGSVTYFMKEAGQEVPPAVLETEVSLMNNAAGIISVSEYSARLTAQYLGHRHEAVVIYNGLEKRGQPLAQTARAHRKAVFSGSLLEKKGIFQLMKAWNIVHDRFPDASLYVLGKGDTQPLKALLTERARPTVHFEGHVSRDRVLEEYATAALAVLPSFAESFGLAAMEAMACGTAVVYTTRTSGPELIRHGVDGLLADPADVDAIARQILWLLEDDERRAGIGMAGLHRFLEHFTLERIARQHIEYYRQLLL